MIDGEAGAANLSRGTGEPARGSARGLTLVGRAETVEPVAEHPGQIVYVDGDTGEVTSVRDVARVPESMRARGGVPVVKVVATKRGDERTIREYGPDDELLSSTVQRR